VLNKNKQYVENKYIMRKYEGGITTLENVDSEKKYRRYVRSTSKFRKTHPNAN
jgi:hypothetical protein